MINKTEYVHNIDGKIIDKKDLIKKIRERCDNAEIDNQERLVADNHNVLIAHFPNGRQKRRRIIGNLQRLQYLSEVEFEKFVYLGDYDAIANYQNNSIEAVVRPLSRLPFTSVTMFKKIIESIDNQITGKVNNQQISISFGEATKEMIALSDAPMMVRSLKSIKINGTNLKRHDNCLIALEKITNSLFMQIDMEYGFPLTLVKSRRQKLPLKFNKNYEEGSLTFPKNEFDEEAISLYWYARSASGMPLLQFLAYYQVIEYYFPVYSQEEAKRRIRNILKNPSFREDKDNDLKRILTVITENRSSFGNEKSQLQATINACVDQYELREYLSSSEELVEFFSGKQKGLTDIKLPISKDGYDLRNDVAELIYDIRCKIVHTKGQNMDGKVELLLPFSKEAELLYYDIMLIQFLARNVLISACAPLNCPEQYLR